MDAALFAALIMFGGAAVLLLLGTPIAISIGLPSFFAMINILPMAGATTTAAQRMFTGLDSFALLAIPFFILAGNIMNNGGIAIRLINCSRIVTGYFPGALAQTNVVSNMLFGSISGSGVASAAAIGPQGIVHGTTITVLNGFRKIKKEPKRRGFREESDANVEGGYESER